MQHVSIEEAQADLGQLLQKVAAGEEVAIVLDQQSAVRLTYVQTPQNRPRFGSAKGQIWMADDFDEPLEEFRKYTE